MTIAKMIHNMDELLADSLEAGCRVADGVVDRGRCARTSPLTQPDRGAPRIMQTA
jgi:hypothetical protein